MRVSAPWAGHGWPQTHTATFKNMQIIKARPAILCSLALAVTAFAADKPAGASVLEGPAMAHLGNVSDLQVPEGCMLLNGDQTRAMLQKAGDPTSGNELGFLRPEEGGWAVYFEFDDIGYIKDAEKEKLDPDKLLKSFKQGTEEANKYRAKSGSPPIEIIGWDKEPVYDASTQNLEWCLRARSGDHEFVNYNTRLLGRKGVMEVVLVVDPANLAATLPEFRSVIAGHKFQTGESYAEYRAGDKIAKYGLGALVLGGAAVGAAKLGLFASLAVFLKKGWKLVVIGLVAAAAGVKKMFNKFTGRSAGD